MLHQFLGLLVFSIVQHDLIPLRLQSFRLRPRHLEVEFELNNLGVEGGFASSLLRNKTFLLLNSGPGRYLDKRFYDLNFFKTIFGFSPVDLTGI